MRSDLDDDSLFVEDGFTEAERAAEAAYWERMRAIDRAADAQVAEIEAEALLREQEEPNPYHGTESEE